MNPDDYGALRVELNVVGDYLTPYMRRYSNHSEGRPILDLDAMFHKTVEMLSLWFRFEKDMDGWKRLSYAAKQKGDVYLAKRYLGYYKRSKLLRSAEMWRLKCEIHELGET